MLIYNIYINSEFVGTVEAKSERDAIDAAVDKFHAKEEDVILANVK